jgi:hypothetical protein
MSRARASLLAGIPFAAVVALLLGRGLAFPLAALGWVIALVALDEPTLTSRYGRHADVGWFQRTGLGDALTYRRGWVPSRAHAWVWPPVLALLFAPGLLVAWLAVGGPPTDLASLRTFAGAGLASPVALLSVAFFAEQLLVQPLIAPFLALGAVVALVAYGVQARPTFWYVLAGVVGFVAVLWAVDLCRVLRRGTPSRPSA